MLKTWLSVMLEPIAPRIVWRHRISAWNLETGEDEQRLLPWACDRKRISIDIGAAAGAYTARLALFSSRVVAFEPRPEAAKELRRMFCRSKITTIEQVALSNDTGTAILRSPLDRPMLSTIELCNSLVESSAIESVPVIRKRLDDYEFSPVGFIKIDAEGHESSILEGSISTIEREHPVFLIEIEDRHNPGSLAHVTGSLSALDYDGYFLLADELVGIQSFDPEAHQNRRNLVGGRRIGTYINNFFFVPRNQHRKVPHICSSQLRN